MENAKKIDAVCLGYSESNLPCDRELIDLGEYSACTVVAHDINVDEAGELTGAMLLSFGPDYGEDRKISPEFASRLADVVNDVIDRRRDAKECGKCEFREHCDACSDSDDDCGAETAKLREELDKLISESEELLAVLKKLAD